MKAPQGFQGGFARGKFGIIPAMRISPIVFAALLAAASQLWAGDGISPLTNCLQIANALANADTGRAFDVTATSLVGSPLFSYSVTIEDDSGATRLNSSALQLGIGEARVEEHVNAIFSKINASNRAEAVAIALRKHLLKV